MKQTYEVALWFCSSVGEHFPGGYVAPDYVGRIKAQSELEAALLFMSGFSLAVPVVYVAAGVAGAQVGKDCSVSAVLRFERGAVAAHRGK